MRELHSYESALAAAMESPRCHEILDLLPVAIYMTDAQGRLSYYNRAAVTLSGRVPELGTDSWCVTWKLYYPDGRPMRHDECPMAMALRERRPIRGMPAIAERPDGTRFWFEPYPSPIFDAEGNLTGGVNMLLDVTERKRIDGQLIAETEALSKLNELSSRLWRAQTVREGLDEMLDATIELLGADFGNVQMLDASREVLHIEAQKGFERPFLEFFREVSAKDESACGRALRSGERIVIDDIETDAQCDSMRPIARTAGYRAVQSTPLIGRDGALLGMLSTHWRRSYRPDDQSLRRLDLYARQAVDFIERKRVEETLRTNRNEITEELRALKRLQQVSLHLPGAGSPESLYDQIIDAAVDIMRSDFASMQMYYPERGVAGELKLLAYRGLAPEAARFWQWVRADSGCTCGQVLRTGVRTTVSDVETCDFMAGTADRAALLEAGIRAAQSTPLISRGGKLLGMLSTHWKKPHQPSERDLRLLDILARQAADWMERLHAEESLRISEERHRQTLALMPAAVYTCDASGEITYYNDRAAQLWGRAPQIGDTDERFCGSDQLILPDGTPLPHAQCPMAVALTEGRSFRDTEVNIRRPDGSLVQVMVNIDPVHDAQGRIIGAINAFHDVSAMKRAESSLRESETRFRAYINATSDVVYRMSPDWSEMRQLEGREFIADTTEASRTWLDRYIHPDDQHAVKEAIAQAIRTKSPFDLEHRVIRLDGSLGWTYSRAIPMLDGEGGIQEWFGAASDISKRKEAEEELRVREMLMAGQGRALELAIDNAPLTSSLGAIVSAAIDTLGGNIRAAIYLSNEDKTALHHVVGMCDDYALAVDGFPVGPDSLSCGLAVHTGKPVITHDVHEEPLWKPWLWLADRTGFSGCWSFPIHTSRESYIGTLAIYSPLPRSATERDIGICSLLTHTASLIITRHTESEVRKIAQNALRETSQLNLLLSQSAARLLQSADPQTVVEQCCTEVLRYLDCQVFFNYLLDGDANRLRLNAYAGISAEEAGKIEWLDFGQAVCGCVARDCAPIIAEEMTTTPDTRTELVKSYGVQAYCCHPLMMQGRLIGTLSFGTRTRSRFTGQDIDAMRAITDLVAMAMNRIQTELSLRESQERFRRSAETFAALVEQSPLGIYTVDADFRVRHVSAGAMPAFRSLLPVIGRDFVEVMRTIWPEPFASEVIAIFRRVLDTGEPYVSPGLTEKRKDIGAIESYEWQVNRVVLADGRFGVVCYFFDSTRLQQALRDLRDSEESFRMIADNMAQLAWTCDTLGNVTWYNKRWLEYTGLSFEEMKGWDWSKVQHPDHLDRVVATVKRSAELGEPWEDTFPLRGADGSYRWFLSRAVPIRDEKGDIVRWFGTNTDITEQRAAEEALKDADRRKDEFLATLAHELRNPLAPIRNSLHILRLAGSEGINADGIHEMMDRQVNHMVRLVDDLMEVSRITRGKIELRKEEVEVAAIVNSAVETSRPLIDAARHELIVNLPPDPLVVEADSVRLAQILTNLLNNAAKYTDDQGRIWLTVERDASSVVISVRDTGVGIPADMLPKVFDLFTQVERTHNRAQGGLGIGLTLVRTLVAMHGGSIEAKSDGPGRGSEFVVRLPVATRRSHREVPSEKNGRPSIAAQRRVLVVDDNRDAASSLAMLLKFLGADVRTVNDGRSALETIQSYGPAIVLLDIGMPEMDGYEVARRVRAERRFQDVTLVALTGWGQEEDRRRSKEAGFDNHLVKPIDLSALQELMSTQPSRSLFASREI